LGEGGALEKREKTPVFDEEGGVSAQQVVLAKFLIMGGGKKPLRN